MKKTIKVLIIIACTVFLQHNTCNAQLDTLETGNRVPNFYYWDTNWWDYYYLNYNTNHSTGFTDKISVSAFVFGNDNCKVECARYCYVEKELDIIGVAGVVYINMHGSTLDSLLPEYFRVYEVGNDTDEHAMVLLAEARWDTFTPRHMMVTEEFYTIRYNMETNTNEVVVDETVRPVYEAYFDHPVTVRDSFYVSGTRENTFCRYERNTQLGHESWLWQHYPTANYLIGGPFYCEDREVYYPKPPHIKKRAHLIDSLYNASYHDTLWHSTWNFKSFVYLFPIFDTCPGCGTDQNDDTCMAPTGFHPNILPYGQGSVVLLWIDNENIDHWDVSLCRDCNNPDDGTITQHSVNFASFNNLDTATWYTAWVRSQCDSINTSDWSDSLRFYVPGESGQGTENITDLADQFTAVIPNPAHGSATVYSSFNIHEIDIYSLNGQLAAKQENINSRSTNLSLQQLEQGTYMLRILTSNGIAYKKLVVK